MGVYLAISCVVTLAVQFCVVLGIPRGRGGAGRGGGVASRTVEIDPGLLERTSSLSHIVSSISSWGWVLIVTTNLVCFGVIVAACRAKCRRAWCCCCWPAGNGGQTNAITCHLCQGECHQAEWDRHRKECAAKQRAKLQAMEKSSGRLRCPKCRARLRKWPVEMGPPFTCKSRECAIIGQIQCNGQNRFACFSCDYDACDSCARRKISQSRQRDRGRTTGRRTGSVRSAASAAAATAASVSWEEEEKERTSNSSEANPEAAKSAAEAPMRPLLSPGAVLPGPTYHRFDESDMEEGPLLPPSYDEAMTQNLLHS